MRRTKHSPEGGAAFGPNPQVELVERVLPDGSRALLPRALEAVEVYAMKEDRVVGSGEGPRVHWGRLTLLNDKLLGRLGIVIIDAGEGLWCFRDELGLRTRRGMSYPPPSEYSARYLSLLSSHW